MQISLLPSHWGAARRGASCDAPLETVAALLGESFVLRARATSMYQTLSVSPGGFIVQGSGEMPRRDRRRRRLSSPEKIPLDEEEGNETAIEYETESDTDRSPSPPPPPRRCFSRRCRRATGECLRDTVICGLLFYMALESYARKHSLWWYADP